MRASELTELMTTSSTDVLDSMYFTTVTGAEIEAALPEPGGDAVSYTLSFLGDISGIFGLSVDTSAALTMAANFLGEEESDVSATEVGEVVGELANMLCGSLVSGMESGKRFVLSHPEPLDSHAITIVPDSASHDSLVLRLDTDYGIVRVWAVVEPNACAL